VGGMGASGYEEGGTVGNERGGEERSKAGVEGWEEVQSEGVGERGRWKAGDAVTGKVGEGGEGGGDSQKGWGKDGGGVVGGCKLYVRGGEINESEGGE